MFAEATRVYRATKKKHDLVFNSYVMRPVAAVVVSWLAPTRVTPNQLTLLNLFIFVVAAALFALQPTYVGGLVAVAVLELSYGFDCVDGMLARFKGMASKVGHVFDFFTDELKAELLVAALSVRLYRAGGIGLRLGWWPAGSTGFLLAGIAGSVIVASALSLTNFVRRPEVSGRESTVEAYYETVDKPEAASIVAKIGAAVIGVLRFINHYPSHLWVFALVGRLDVFFWIYVAINLLYLGRGWLGLIVRFGRS
jgi:phosphatidylglycerophosphate synthase